MASIHLCYTSVLVLHQDWSRWAARVHSIAIYFSQRIPDWSLVRGTVFQKRCRWTRMVLTAVGRPLPRGLFLNSEVSNYKTAMMVWSLARRSPKICLWNFVTSVYEWWNLKRKGSTFGSIYFREDYVDDGVSLSSDSYRFFGFYEDEQPPDEEASLGVEAWTTRNRSAAGLKNTLRVAFSTTAPKGKKRSLEKERSDVFRSVLSDGWSDDVRRCSSSSSSGSTASLHNDRSRYDNVSPGGHYNFRPFSIFPFVSCDVPNTYLRSWSRTHQQTPIVLHNAFLLFTAWLHVKVASIACSSIGINRHLCLQDSSHAFLLFGARWTPKFAAGRKIRANNFCVSANVLVRNYVMCLCSSFESWSWRGSLRRKLHCSSSKYCG